MCNTRWRIKFNGMYCTEMEYRQILNSLCIVVGLLNEFSGLVREESTYILIIKIHAFEKDSGKSSLSVPFCASIYILCIPCIIISEVFFLGIIEDQLMRLSYTVASRLCRYENSEYRA